MTSKQAMLRPATFLLALVWCGGLLVVGPGCGRSPEWTPVSPSDRPLTWAVAPFRNESGTLHADGVLAADHVVRQLLRVDRLNVLPLNQTLAKMDEIGVQAIGSKSDALALREALGVDGLVIGSVTAYDPYDPPKLGLTLELYADDSASMGRHFDLGQVRSLQEAATGQPGLATTAARDRRSQPVLTVQGYFDGRSAAVRERIRGYAGAHGNADGPAAEYAERLYLISMDLFTEYASFEVAARLILDETLRQAELHDDPKLAARPPS